jgi:hypothetical protein
MACKSACLPVLRLVPLNSQDSPYLERVDFPFESQNPRSVVFWDLTDILGHREPSACDSVFQLFLSWAMRRYDAILKILPAIAWSVSIMRKSPYSSLTCHNRQHYHETYGPYPPFDIPVEATIANIPGVWWAFLLVMATFSLRTRRAILTMFRRAMRYYCIEIQRSSEATNAWFSLIVPECFSSTVTSTSGTGQISETHGFCRLHKARKTVLAACNGTLMRAKPLG